LAERQVLPESKRLCPKETARVVCAEEEEEEGMDRARFGLTFFTSNANLSCLLPPASKSRRWDRESSHHACEGGSAALTQAYLTTSIAESLDSTTLIRVVGATAGRRELHHLQKVSPRQNCGGS